MHADAVVRVVAVVALARLALIVPVALLVVGCVGVAHVAPALEVRALCPRVGVHTAVVVGSGPVGVDVVLARDRV